MVDSRDAAEPVSSPVAYIERTHRYYQAQGFEQVYQYAHFEDTPFVRPNKPLSECRVGLITTASLTHRPPLSPRRVASTDIEPAPERLFTDDLSWDKQATHTNDLNSYCPIATLKDLNNEGFIGGLTPRLHCAPTEYSQRATREKDAPELLRRLKIDGADVVLLVPL
ncbi:MAG: hypothetical protein ACFHXK_06735 [bacterium]